MAAGSISIVLQGLKRRIGAIVVLVGVVLIAAACSSSGFPTSYEDQLNDEGVSNVEQNWMEQCQVKADELMGDNANTVCACSYSRIKAQIPFDDFIAMDDRLREDVGSLIASANDANSTEAATAAIVAGCIADS